MYLVYMFSSVCLFVATFWFPSDTLNIPLVLIIRLSVISRLHTMKITRIVFRLKGKGQHDQVIYGRGYSFHVIPHIQVQLEVRLYSSQYDLYCFTSNVI